MFAVDLWIEPSENYGTFRIFKLDDKVIPIRAEAHALPFAHDFFDAVVCIGAYNYFGTSPSYLDTYIVPLVKKGGIIAIAVPGLQQDFVNGIPSVLKPFWQDNMNFFSANWWKELWKQSSHVEIKKCFSLACHKEAWNDWLQCDNPYAPFVD